MKDITFKKGARVLVHWAKDWELATYIKQGTQEGTVIVKIDGDPFEVQISAKDVRPVKESK